MLEPAKHVGQFDDLDAVRAGPSRSYSRISEPRRARSRPPSAATATSTPSDQTSNSTMWLSRALPRVSVIVNVAPVLRTR
ncbi:MAG TPA: hypothetical protein VFV67_27055 [Actinophytocola sp.]|uniref:hypothetical protein n=1 Tax=Actinophytocola sp. TaxID=1872138 RepID=UPI002DB8CBE3|nr:hypothetical protein [Actinophytocola sp.]HEU5474324.1 hypothetical protein [Actinophytocola sp.]